LDDSGINQGARVEWGSGSKRRTRRYGSPLAALLSRLDVNGFQTVIAFTESCSLDWHGEGKKTALRHLRYPNKRNAAMTASPAVFAAVEALTTAHAPGALFLNRLFGGIGAKDKRKKLAATYQNLLCADDYILRDVGMTRLDVMRLREDLLRK
jgi:hypothetical protein